MLRENMYKETNPKLLRAIISYMIGLIFLYLSIFLSSRIKYTGHFISVIPVIFPLVFAMVSFGVSVLFILTKTYPWLFRTGIMSLVIGLSMFIFGIISFNLKVSSIVWAGSVGIGVLFILGAMVRLLIQGGLGVYRKSKNIK